MESPENDERFSDLPTDLGNRNKARNRRHVRFPHSLRPQPTAKSDSNSKPERSLPQFAYPSLPSGSSFNWKRLGLGNQVVEECDCVSIDFLPGRLHVVGHKDSSG